ncbi:MAG: restriction endonuclease subunit S [Candidatus Omnitrophica bacterium]|jgi:type I restriction enzyme S subunit|nr:restriction endonuclease subunit S [Candidatus Omnitrophota bacterium]
MSNRWENKTLGEVCEILDNRRKPITKRDRTAGEYPYYGATGILDYVHDYIFDEKLILIGEDGAKWGAGENTAFIAEGKYWVNNHAHVIRPDRKIVLDNWLVYFLNFSDLSKYVTGLTVPKLNQAKMREISLPLPPISEQKKMLHVIDEIFEKTTKAKENAEKNLQNARELFESYLQSIFANPGDDWEEKSVGEIADIEYGFTDKAKYAGDYRYIRITDIDKNGNLVKDGKVFVDASEEAKKYLLKDGDLLMVRTGATYAKVLLYKDIEKSIFASYLIRIKFRQDIVNKLYWYFSKSRIYWEQANKLSSGSAQPQFNGGVLKELVFYFPRSFEKQGQIVTKLDALSTEIKKLEIVYQQKLIDLEELKKPILHKAFNGELAGVCS